MISEAGLLRLGEGLKGLANLKKIDVHFAK